MPWQKSAEKGIVLGVTGSFGSGKTTVAKFLQGSGAKLIDADKLAHKFLKPGSKTHSLVIRAFGLRILRKNKTIDRSKLARLVFGKKHLLKRLNNIIHPEVIKLIDKQLKSARERVVVLDAPLLIEAGLKSMVDKVIVVKATRRKQIERIQKKTSLSRLDILKRINNQAPLSIKLGQADFIIDNSGTLKQTKKQVAEIRRKLWKS